MVDNQSDFYQCSCGNQHYRHKAEPTKMLPAICTATVGDEELCNLPVAHEIHFHADSTPSADVRAVAEQTSRQILLDVFESRSEFRELTRNPCVYGLLRNEMADIITEAFAGTEPSVEAEYDQANSRVEKYMQGYIKGQHDRAVDWCPMIEQFCKDLNHAHDELLRAQGVAESDFRKFDWPEWAPQANSVRWAENLLKKKLAKTDHWSLFPEEGK